jgi:hypothetical protein
VQQRKPVLPIGRATPPVVADRSSWWGSLQSDGRQTGADKHERGVGVVGLGIAVTPVRLAYSARGR